MNETLRENIIKIIQDAYMAGDEGEPEESAVPSATDDLISLFKSMVEECEPEAKDCFSIHSRPESMAKDILNKYKSNLLKALGERV